MQRPETSTGRHQSNSPTTNLRVSHSFFTSKRVGYSLAGAFLLISAAATITATPNNEPKGHNLNIRSTDADHASVSSETSSQDTSPVAEGTASATAFSATTVNGNSSTTATLNVNGQNVPIPQNGTSTQTITNDNGSTTTVDVNSNTTGSGQSTNTSFSSFSLNVDSSSTSTGGSTSQ